MLGYLAKNDRIFVCDKNINFTSFSFPLSLIDYQTAILQNDFARADSLLPQIPLEHRNRIAKFLESRGIVFLKKVLKKRL